MAPSVGHPDVSVVIPAWNCDSVLRAQLEALLEQDSGPAFEVIVADNGSTDGTAALARTFAERDRRIVLVDASRRSGASAARNVGAEAARADKLLFCDSDDVAGPTWLSTLANALDEHGAVGGWLEMFLDRPGDLPGSGRSAVSPFGTAHFLISASMGVTRSVWEATGGFDESWGPGEDIELSLRLLRSGHRFERIDDAVMYKRVADRPGAVWRQHYRYGVQRARAAATFPEFVGPRNLRGAARKWAWMIMRLPFGWRDRDVLGPSAMAVGRLRGSVRYRTIYL